MANPEKVAAVAELTNRFSNSAGAVLTEYRGLSVKALKELRRSLGDDATYAVSKNTLTTIAAREAEIEGVEEHLVGPTAIAFIEGDPVAVAKGLRDFARANPFLVIKGGVLDGKALTAEDVRKLADLESREVLLAKVAGGMMGVLQQAIGLVSAPLSQTARLLAALQQAAENDPALLAAGSGEPTNEELAAAEDTSEPTNEELAEATASTDSTGSTDSSTDSSTEISSDSTDSSTEISTETSTDSTTETDTTTTDAASAAEDN